MVRKTSFPADYSPVSLPPVSCILSHVQSRHINKQVSKQNALSYTQGANICLQLIQNVNIFNFVIFKTIKEVKTGAAMSTSSQNGMICICSSTSEVAVAGGKGTVALP